MDLGGVARLNAVNSDLAGFVACIDWDSGFEFKILTAFECGSTLTSHLALSVVDCRAGPNPQPSDMEVATANVLEELSAMGVDVTPFKSKGSGKQWIWNEVRK